MYGDERRYTTGDTSDFSSYEPYGDYFLFHDQQLKDHLDTIIYDLEKCDIELGQRLSELIKALKKDKLHFVKNRLGILQGTYKDCSSQTLQFCYLRLIKACIVLLQNDSLAEQKRSNLTQIQTSFFYKLSVISNGPLRDSEMSQNVQLFSLQRQLFQKQTKEELADYRRLLSTQFLWKLSPVLCHRRFDRVMFLLDAYYEFYRSSFMFEEKGAEEILSSFYSDLQESFKAMPVKVQRRFSKGMVNLSSFEMSMDVFNNAAPWLTQSEEDAQNASKKVAALLNTLKTIYTRLPFNQSAQQAIEKKYRKAPSYLSPEDFAKGYSRIPRKHKHIIWKLLQASPLEERKKVLTELEVISGEVVRVSTKKRFRFGLLTPLKRPLCYFRNRFFPHKSKSKRSVASEAMQSSAAQWRQSSQVR